MEKEDGDLVDRVHDLSDLELAVLLSLVSHGHCVIGTPENAIGKLVDELGLVSDTLGSIVSVNRLLHANTSQDIAKDIRAAPYRS